VVLSRSAQKPSTEMNSCKISFFMVHKVIEQERELCCVKRTREGGNGTMTVNKVYSTSEIMVIVARGRGCCAAGPDTVAVAYQILPSTAMDCPSLARTAYARKLIL